MVTLQLQRIALALGLAAAVPAAAQAARCDAAPQWRLMFVNGPDGEDIGGNRDALLAAIRRGSPIRVGWGEAAADGSWAVEEFSGTGFVNIMGRRDVVAQLEPALIQSHYLDAARAGLRTPLVDWHATMATNGRFEAVTTDRKTGEQVRLLVQRTRVHWFALAPDPACDRRAIADIARNGETNRVERDERPPR